MGRDQNWDQSRQSIIYEGKNKIKSSSNSSMISYVKNNISELKKFIFNITTAEFLSTSTYFNKQLPETIKNFNDPEFPPNLNSLLYINKNNDAALEVTSDEMDTLKSFSWARPEKVMKHNKYVLYDKIDIEDIIQGHIGNCYFLSSISAIAEFQERFDNIFVTKQANKEGVYQVRLIIQGIPEIVVIDDHFPVRDGRFAGASSGKNEIWVQVIEKAWAKINGSYASTIAGLPSEALAALTRAPVVPYIHKKYAKRIDELWQIIRDSDRSNYILCTNTGNNAESEKAGLVASHAYTIIGAYEEMGVRLMKLRNPWGSFEWLGKFGDNSDEWAKYPGLKEKVGYVKGNDGIFFMTFDDFLTYYPYTFICKYENGFHYDFKKVQQPSNLHMTSFKIKITQPTKITIGLHQKQQRFYNKVKGYKPQMARIILSKFTNGKYTFINSDSNDNEKLFIECESLEPGEYHVICNVNWIYDTPCRYVISTYSSNPVPIELLNREEIPNDYLVRIFSSYLSQNCQERKENGNWSHRISVGDNDTGFYLASFYNYNERDSIKLTFQSSYSEKLEFISYLDLQDRKLNQDAATKFTNDSFSFILQPKSEVLLFWKLLANPWQAKITIQGLSSQNIGYYKDNSDSNLTSSNEDFNQNFLQEYLRTENLHKRHLTLDFNLIELEKQDELYLVFENCNARVNYRVQIIFNNLTNLQGDLDKPVQIDVLNQNFNYLTLKKVNRSTECKCNYLISYKRM